MSASSRGLGYLSRFSQLGTRTKARKPTYRIYTLVHDIATALPRRIITEPNLQYLRSYRDWLGPLPRHHRYITEVIFSGGNVGTGHWSRFHRFFSHASWDLDDLSHGLGQVGDHHTRSGATFLWAVEKTLYRKRGLTLYGFGMHYDPLISGVPSRSSLGARLGRPLPRDRRTVLGWVTTKVFALPIAFRLYRNRQGLTKGKRKGCKNDKEVIRPKQDPNHRTRASNRPSNSSNFAAHWFPNDEIII